ncbi:hypothetical protein QR680_009183 [Steinernema hermaphroditum]|uniref:Uncharacterized protein n=1 Tax=Steinernema hermaphroditum TaxID=289476 RepID=A0AA39M8Y8_9BILA|nr:hypothetical protein QR680_009183 [Steinernema hermaphroditum]
MTCVVPLLASFCLCAVTIVVAAPTSSDRDTVIQRSSAAKIKGPFDFPAGTSRRRRSKREVFVEETPEEELYDAVSDQLRGLNDEQLQLLAEIVQQEMDSYDPQQALDDFEVVEVPIDFSRTELVDELFPRDRRGTPSTLDDEEDENETLLVLPGAESDLVEGPELLLIPQELVEQPEEDFGVASPVDDMELRLRIAELANLLNERAFRGL